MRVLSFFVIVALVVGLVPQAVTAAPRKGAGKSRVGKRVLSPKPGRMPGSKTPARKVLRRTFGKLPVSRMKALASGKTLLVSVKNPVVLRGFGFVTMKGARLLVSLRESKFLVRNPKSANKGLLLRNLKKGGKIAIDGVPVEKTGRVGFVMAESGGGTPVPPPPPTSWPIGKVKSGRRKNGSIMMPGGSTPGPRGPAPMGPIMAPREYGTN